MLIDLGRLIPVQGDFTPEQVEAIVKAANLRLRKTGCAEGRSPFAGSLRASLSYKISHSPR